MPTETLLGFDQEYEDLSGLRFARTADGTGILRSAWTGKVRTVINGRGWVPSGFENVSAGSSYTLKCAVPRQASDADVTVTLPAARRTDTGHTPVGYAIVGDALVETAITGITSNVATLTSVAGATGYRVHYWPQITCVILRNTCKGEADANYTWTIEAEEI